MSGEDPLTVAEMRAEALFRTCLGCDGHGFVDEALCHDECQACCGLGVLRRGQPSDALADAETLRKAMWRPGRGYYLTQIYRAEARGEWARYNALSGYELSAWRRAREAAHAAFRAVPALRDGDAA